MSFLTRPTTHYKESYLQALREFQQEGRYTNYNLKHINKDFDLYIQHLYTQEERDKTAPDRVPNADFWLIDNYEFIGRMSLRYKLNEHLLKLGGNIGYEIRPSKRRMGYGKEILRLSLLRAKQDGLQRVLVTCDEDNIGSRKIIEHNGGHFENAVAAETEGSPKKRRYWFDLT